MAKKPLDLDQLCQSIKASRLQTKYPREMRREMVKDSTGAYYFEESSQVPNPINFIALYRQIIGRALISQNPQVLITTFNRQSKPIAAAMETWMNRQIKKLDLQNVFARTVDDALFWYGMIEVGIATPSDAFQTSYSLKTGEPYVCRVSPNDYFWDIHARVKEECQYEGNFYRALLSTIRDDGKLYSKDRKDLIASDDSWFNAEGDEQTSAMGRMPYGGGKTEYKEMVDLCKIYIPGSREWVILPCDGQRQPYVPASGEPLRRFPWVGKYCSPYHMLGLMSVPDNISPIGPIHFIYDLQKQINNNARKGIGQSHRGKKITLYRSSADKDADKVRKSSDGDMIPCDDTDGIKEIVVGGADPALFATMLQYWDIANKQAGNVELAGGLSPQSKTLGQDKMLNENATRQISDMQDQTVGFVGEVCEALGEIYWYHPEMKMDSHFSLPGLPEFSVPNPTITPMDRVRTQYEDMDLSVAPYSLQHKTPDQMVQEMDDVVKNIILPGMGLLQQQGANFNIQAYLSLRARYKNNPSIMEIIDIQEPPQEEGRIGNGGAASEGAGMPQETTRNYNRTSVGSNPTNRQADMMNQLAAASAQQGQT